MLRTRTPLSLVASYQIPLDLHVLGLPLAFILSQDQTLHCISFPKTYSLFNIQYISPSLYIFYLGRISSIFNVLLSRPSISSNKAYHLICECKTMKKLSPHPNLFAKKFTKNH